MQLIHGGCLEEMAKLADGSVALTVTSPPYDNLRTYNGSLEWGEHVWKPVLSELCRITKTGGVVVWIVNDATIEGSETGTSFKQALYAMECGFRLHDTMIWHKPNPMPLTHNRYEQAFEYIFVLSNGRPSVWNPTLVPCKCAGMKRGGTFQHDGDGLRKEKHLGGVYADTKQDCNVITLAGKSETAHPAEFPKQLAKKIISTWSNKGDVVFDPFTGSGTTGVCCVELSRDFIGTEKNTEYYEIAKKRIADAERNKANQLPIDI
jgi:DNA modification methylase